MVLKVSATADAPIIEDDAFIAEALESASVLALAMSVVHITGDLSFLNEIKRIGATPRNIEGDMTVDDRRKIRARALEALIAYRDGEPMASPPSADALARMLNFVVGQEVSPEYVPMMVDELGFAGDGKLAWKGGQPPKSAARFHTLVIGAGMSGLLQAYRLSEAGLPFLVVEKNDEVGGAWYENEYPGCRVDSSNHAYSYSFAPNNDWSEFYSQRDELAAYFKQCSEQFGIRDKIRFNTEVTEARFDDDDLVWNVTLRNRDGDIETIRVNAVVSAVGQLNRPAIPDFKGRERFRGPSFHAAAWEHGHQLQGKRIAVVGAGATAFQLIPEMAKIASYLVCFQRSPGWMVPNPRYHDAVDPGKLWLLKHLPFYQRWYRFILFWTTGDGALPGLTIDPNWPHQERSVNMANEELRKLLTAAMVSQFGDREDLVEKVVPKYPPGGKRMLQDNGHYLRSLTSKNVEVVSEGIAEIVEDGVIDTAGHHHELDAIVFATGFHANKFLWPMKIVGRRGKVLSDAWGDSPRAYLGLTTPDFPNLFILYGPGTNLAHGGSIIFHSEAQVRYVMKCLKLLVEGGHSAMDVRRAAYDDYIQRLEETLEKMVWSHPGVTSWYKNARGIVVNTSPWRLVDYWTWTHSPDPADYELMQPELQPA